MQKSVTVLTALLMLGAAAPALAKGKAEAKKTPAVTASKDRAGKHDPDAALKQAFENRYKDFHMAAANGTGAQVSGLLADGYTNTDLAGTVRDTVKILSAMAAAVPDDGRTETTTVTSVKVDGDKAAIGQTDDLTTIRKDKNGKTINYHMVTTYDDTWVKVKDQWLLQKSVAETGDVYIDGKLAAHRARGEAPPAPARDAAKTGATPAAAPAKKP